MTAAQRAFVLLVVGAVLAYNVYTDGWLETIFWVVGCVILITLFNVVMAVLGHVGRRR